MVDRPTALETHPLLADELSSPARAGTGPAKPRGLPRKRIPQGVLTVVTPACPKHTNDLVELLNDLGGRRGPELDAALEDARTLHFLRWAVIGRDQSSGDGACGPLLVLSTNYDGRRRAHVDELVERLGPILQEVYNHCRDYPGPEGLGAYLLKNHRRHAAFFNGALYRTRSRIEAERRLFERIQEILGDGRDLVGEDVRTVVQRELAGDVESSPELADLLEGPFPRPWLYAVARRFGDPPVWALAAPPALAVFLLAAPVFLLAGWSAGAAIVGAAVVVLVLGGLGVLGYLLVLTYLARVKKRETERLEKRLDPGAGACEVKETPIPLLEMDEDRQLQNQLTLLNRAKPGRFRWFLLRASLLAVSVLSRVWFRPLERLGRLRTIHFAHWVLLPERRQLLFISNYDGPWSPYLDAFTQHGTIWGLNAIWTNTAGYPDTCGLIHDGPEQDRKRPQFKQWARRHQVRTQVWYSAYPFLSVSRINLHSRVHEGLFGRPGPEATREWLAEL